MAWYSYTILLLWSLVLARAQPPPQNVSKADFEISATMLGFVVFMMTSLYVLNHSNPVLRTGGWLAVSKALCCFMGVLINMSMYSNLAYWLGPYGAQPPFLPPNWFTTFLYIILLVFWWSLKQVATAWSLGLLPWQTDLDTAAVADGSDCCSRQTYAVQLDAIGTVLGFCSASAVMQSAASLQQMGRGTKYEDFVVLGIMPVFFLVMYVFLRFGNRLRDWIANRDGSVTFGEHAWGAYMDFSENKGISLGFSHMMVQAIRFYMFDRQYPGVMGQQLQGSPTYIDACMLLLCGFGFVTASCLSMFLPSSWGRVKQWCRMSTMLAVAWCFLYSINWSISYYFGQRPFTRLCQTCGCTILGNVLMFALTKLKAFLKTRHKKGAVLAQDLFVPIAVLIGFSWRDAWQGALQIVVTKFPGVPPPVGTAVAAFFMLVLVAPAWRWYILPTTFIRWVPATTHSEIGDTLEAEFQLPFWLDNALEEKKVNWEHEHHKPLHRALLAEAGKIVSEMSGAIKDMRQTV